MLLRQYFLRTLYLVVQTAAWANGLKQSARMNLFVGCFLLLAFFLAAVFLLKPLLAQQLMPLLSRKIFRFSRLFLLIFLCVQLFFRLSFLTVFFALKLHH
jgi:Ca2+/Na+ antiporter